MSSAVHTFQISGFDPESGKKITRTVQIDREDKEFITQFNWTLKRVSGALPVRYHAVREVSIGGRKQTIRMHRVISEAASDTRTVHIDGNTLNNRRANLAQRKLNPWTGRVSGLIGVHQATAGRWTAQIEFAGLTYDLTPRGGVDDPAKAARVYNDAAMKLFGKHAVLNVIT